MNLQPINFRHKLEYHLKKLKIIAFHLEDQTNIEENADKAFEPPKTAGVSELGQRRQA